MKKSFSDPLRPLVGGSRGWGVRLWLCWALLCLGPPSNVTLGISYDLGQLCHVTLGVLTM